MYCIHIDTPYEYNAYSYIQIQYRRIHTNIRPDRQIKKEAHKITETPKGETEKHIEKEKVLNHSHSPKF